MQTGIEKYSEFNLQLREVLLALEQGPVLTPWRENAVAYLDGKASQEVRRLVSLKNRRKFGIFFTDSDLAIRVLEILAPEFKENSYVYDPACGAGNLLLAALLYGNHTCGVSNLALAGTDIHLEFVEAAMLRLELNRHLSGVFDTFPLNITQLSALEDNEHYQAATHIYFNPPFNQAKLNLRVSWASGKINLAAIFVEKAIEFCRPGTVLCGILPDVLRSGSRYEKWRKVVNKLCKVERVELLGQFDEHADVDVFAIRMVKREEPITDSHSFLEQRPEVAPKKLSDLFEISVGPVVDYRDSHSGRRRGYIVSKGLAGWVICDRARLVRAHSGRAFAGPFVVIKRTSRSGDPHRAVATIINTPNPVYVDNHLIIVRPKYGGLSECEHALEILHRPQTSQWLDQVIRCRHLTIKAIADIPVL